MINVLSHYNSGRPVTDKNSVLGSSLYSCMPVYGDIFKRVVDIRDADAIDVCGWRDTYRETPLTSITNKKKIIAYWGEYPGITNLQGTVRDIHLNVLGGTVAENIYLFLCDTNSSCMNRENPYADACRALNMPIHDISCYFRVSYESFITSNMPNHVTPNIERCKLNNFLSLNSKVNKFHRIAPILVMKELGIYDKGIVTINLPDYDIDFLEFFKEFDAAKLAARYNINPADFFNILLNRKIKDTVGRKYTDHFGFPTNPELFESTFMSFISETHSNSFDGSDPRTFFPTEKTFRAILNCHPFIVVSNVGFLKNLRSFGYKTFSPYIDESYDDEPDEFLRIKKAVNALKQTISYPFEVKKKIYDIAEYNYYHALTRIENDNDRVIKLLKP